MFEQRSDQKSEFLHSFLHVHSVFICLLQRYFLSVKNEAHYSTKQMGSDTVAVAMFVTKHVYTVSKCLEVGLRNIIGIKQTNKEIN